MPFQCNLVFHHTRLKGLDYGKGVLLDIVWVSDGLCYLLTKNLNTLLQAASTTAMILLNIINLFIYLNHTNIIVNIVCLTG